MRWYRGPALLQAIDEFQPTQSAEEQPLRFPIQDVYRTENRRILVGRIESGTLRVGDQLLFSPHHKTARVATIERWPASSVESASSGESVGITLREDRKSTRLNSSHSQISYAVFCLKKKINLDLCTT